MKYAIITYSEYLQNTHRFDPPNMFFDLLWCLLFAVLLIPRVHRIPSYN